MIGVVLTEISVIGVVLFLVNALVGLLLWALKSSVDRNVRQNDAKLDKQDLRLDGMSAALAEETRSRHDFHQKLSDRIWAESTHAAQTYATQEQAMRQYGQLRQQIQGTEDRIATALTELPCHVVQCPTKG